MNHYQLETYISGFRAELREDVYKQILDAGLLEKAFETSEGKAILNNCVDLITSNVLQIISHCAGKPPEEASKQIYPYAFEINTVFKIMQDWEKLLIRGSEHKEKAEQIKG